MTENREKNTYLEYYFKEFIKTEPDKGGVSKKKNPDFICDLLIHEPRSVEEAQLGILFILGKIVNIPEDRYKNFDFLLNLLISVIKREFYSDPERSPEKAIEASLHNANLYLEDFTDKGNSEWIGNLHFVCGVLTGNKLYLAKTGDLLIKLIRGESISHIDKRFPESEKKLSPLNTFSNIVSGRLLDKDKILICNKKVLDKIGLSDIKKFGSANCGFIINFLKKSLEKEKVDYPLLCLAIEARAKEEFLQKEKITAQAVFQKEALIEKVNNKTKASYLNKAKPLFLKAFVFVRLILKISFLVLKYLGILLYKAYKFICPLFKKIIQSRFFQRLSPIFQKTRKFFTKTFTLTTEKIKKWLLGYRNNIVKLYNKNKPAFCVASLLAVLVLVLCFTIINQLIYHAKINKFNYEFTKIQTVQEKTELFLIYQDRERAKLLFEKSQDFFNNILNFVQKNNLDKNLEIKEKLASLGNTQQQLRDSFSNIKRPNLEKVFSFKDSGFIVKPAGIEKNDNKLYFYELESGILYRLGLESTSQESGDIDKKLALIFISAKDELRKMTVVEGKGLVLIGQSGKIYLYDPNSNEHAAYSADPEIVSEKTKDIDSFSSSFYLLSPEENKIIKYSLTNNQNAVIQGENWLKEEPTEEFNKTKSIAIDGLIYLLTDNKIIEYYRGKKQKEILLFLENSLGKENKLFTKPGFQYFYVSDPDNHRILVLDKEGRVVYQLVNREFSRLLDFWVTKDEKTIYLLCNTEVYKLDI